jgi:hypothetical protein
MKNYLYVINNQNTAGAATAPARVRTVGKWANTSQHKLLIDLKLVTEISGKGSILKVWGSD